MEGCSAREVVGFPKFLVAQWCGCVRFRVASRSFHGCRVWWVAQRRGGLGCVEMVGASRVGQGGAMGEDGGGVRRSEVHVSGRGSIGVVSVCTHGAEEKKEKEA